MPSTPALFLLVLAVLPLWCLSGFVDWTCHRRTNIAETSGLKENLLHWLMFAEAGLGVVLAALFDVSAGLLAVLGVLFLLHEATTAWDLQDSTLQRDVGPLEQMVHSFQEVLPLLALALLALDAWPGLVPLDWGLHRREALPPMEWVAACALLVGAVNVLPLSQETWACLAARRRAARRVAARKKAGPAQAAAPGPSPAPAAAASAPPAGRVEPGLDPLSPRTPANPAPR